MLMLVLAAFVTAAQANSPILVDGAGRAIGYVLGSDYCTAGPGAVAVISKTGYLTCVNVDYGEIDFGIIPPGGAGLDGGYFLTTDCSGALYAAGNNPAYSGGMEFRSSGGYYLVMVPPGSLPSSRMIGSHQIARSSCDTFGGSPQSMDTIPMFPADSAVTGISAVPYRAPLSIQVLPDSSLEDVIFFDGNEFLYVPN
jgi:hypothetical protein